MTPAEEANLERRYLEFLDWPAVCTELAARAHSSRGGLACQGLALCETVAEAAERMAEITEAVSILRAGESLPVLGFPEIEAHLRAVAQGVPLGPEELRQVADFCEVVASARRFFGRLQPDGVLQTPRLSRLAAQLGYHEELTRLARETFDATGELRDSASPELGHLRSERDQLAARAREAAERILRSDELAPYLQDQFVTLREDRFVLPLRASFKSMGLGIVHDTSRTGETVFVEPTALVELNNRLKVAELAIRHESRRIDNQLRGRAGRQGAQGGQVRAEGHGGRGEALGDLEARPSLVDEDLEPAARGLGRFQGLGDPPAGYRPQGQLGLGPVGDDVGRAAPGQGAEVPGLRPELGI